jgi:membrane protease YdiL (CAAX protease family)
MNPNDFGTGETPPFTQETEGATPDTPPPPSIKGIPLIWTFLFLLLAVASIIAIWGEIPLEETHPDRILLRNTLDRLSTDLTFKEIRNPFGKLPPEVYEPMIKELEKLPLKTKGAKGSAARAILILKQAAHPDLPPDFSQLNEETDDILNPELRQEAKQARQRLNQALKELYSAKTLSHQDAERIQKTILQEAGETFPYSLALERAREISGQQQAYMQKMLAIGMGFAGMFLLGMGVIVAYVVLRLQGRAQPEGLPLRDAPRPLGDHLALRMLAYLVAFLGLGSLVGSLVANGLGESWGGLISVLVGLLIAILLLYVPLAGIPLSLRALGLKAEDLSKGVFWGVMGWLANVPFLTFLIPIGLVFRWIPSREHPVVTQVAESEAWLPVFLTGSLLAPIAEEIFFRGCLFQGLWVRTRRIVLSLVISGLVFAGMHPQGGVALPGLAWVGIMAGFLTYQTGSLMPAIVMHMLHNTSLLLILRLLRT